MEMYYKEKESKRQSAVQVLCSSVNSTISSQRFLWIPSPDEDAKEADFNRQELMHLISIEFIF